jgi:hypothetical protein
MNVSKNWCWVQSRYSIPNMVVARTKQSLVHKVKTVFVSHTLFNHPQTPKYFDHSSLCFAHKLKINQPKHKPKR